MVFWRTNVKECCNVARLFLKHISLYAMMKEVINSLLTTVFDLSLNHYV
jgi:hypothetical protein